MDFYTIAERLGIPTAVLVSVGVGIWYTLKWLAREVVKPITASHIALVHSTKETNVLNGKTLDKVATLLELKAGTLNKIELQNEKILILANMNHELLNDLKKEAGET